MVVGCKEISKSREDILEVEEVMMQLVELPRVIGWNWVLKSKNDL